MLLQVVGKGASQKLFRVIPANNSNLRALTAAPTLLLHQMCKPEQLINLQSVRSVKIPVMASQQLSGMSVQQQLVVPFQSQLVKKEPIDNQTLIDSLLQAAEMKQEPVEQIKVEQSELTDVWFLLMIGSSDAPIFIVLFYTHLH